MSAAEMDSFIRGDHIQNTKDHNMGGNRTNSIGACFMVVDGQENDGVYWAARFLAGIATTEYCLVGELRHSKWRKGFGYYGDRSQPQSDPLQALLRPAVKRKELSTTHYSQKDFKSFRVYGPAPITEIEGHKIADMEPLMQSFAWSSSYPWQEPVLLHGDLRKAKVERGAKII